MPGGKAEKDVEGQHAGEAELWIHPAGYTVRVCEPNPQQRKLLAFQLPRDSRYGILCFVVHGLKGFDCFFGQGEGVPCWRASRKVVWEGAILAR